MVVEKQVRYTRRSVIESAEESPACRHGEGSPASDEEREAALWDRSEHFLAPERRVVHRYARRSERMVEVHPHSQIASCRRVAVRGLEDQFDGP